MSDNMWENRRPNEQTVWLLKIIGSKLKKKKEENTFKYIAISAWCKTYIFNGTQRDMLYMLLVISRKLMTIK